MTVSQRREDKAVQDVKTEGEGTKILITICLASLYASPSGMFRRGRRSTPGPWRGCRGGLRLKRLLVFPAPGLSSIFDDTPCIKTGRATLLCCAFRRRGPCAALWAASTARSLEPCLNLAAKAQTTKPPMHHLGDSSEYLGIT